MTKERQQAISECIKKLDAEPITHLMLGHRELFHSNILAWFFTNIPRAADQVFLPLTRPQSVYSNTQREVKREKDNLDLRFYWPNQDPLIIENKVFSLPDERQLERYSAIANKVSDSSSLWLLSLSDPGWTHDVKLIGGREWRWISYRYLAGKINSALSPDDYSYPVETMRRYALVINILSDLVALYTTSEPADKVWIDERANDALDGDRIRLSMTKLRAKSIANHISKTLYLDGIYDAKVGSSLTNATPLIDCFFPCPIAPRARAGWQLQGNQFRLALILPHLDGRSPEKREERFKFANTHKDIFDFELVDKIIGTGTLDVRPAITPRNPLGFNRYDPDFVYRFKPVRDLTIQQLEEAAIVIANRLRSNSEACVLPS